VTGAGWAEARARRPVIAIVISMGHYAPRMGTGQMDDGNPATGRKGLETPTQ